MFNCLFVGVCILVSKFGDGVVYLDIDYWFWLKLESLRSVLDDYFIILYFVLLVIFFNIYMYFSNNKYK